MSAQPPFKDYNEGEFQRHERARTGRARAALFRSAGVAATGELDLYSPPDDETQRLLADFGHTTDSANVLLAEYDDFTDPMARLVNALIGIAGDRVCWFEASDWLIANRAARSEKWVQTTRKDFIAWQNKHYVSVVDIEDHLYDPQHGNQPHRYRVHLARLAAEATLDARASREWRRHPGRALEQSAKNLRKMLPPPVHKRRKPDRPDDAATQIKRKLKHMGTLMDRVDEIREATGGQVELDLAVIKDLENRLAVLKAAAVDPFSTTYEERVLEMRHARRDAAPVSPALRDLPRDEDHAPLVYLTEEGGSQPEGGGNNFQSPPTDQAESTVYENHEFPNEPEKVAEIPPDDADLPPDDETALYVREVRESLTRKMVSGRTEAEAYREVQSEIGEFDDWQRRRTAVFDQAFGGLKGSGPSPGGG